MSLSPIVAGQQCPQSGHPQTSSRLHWLATRQARRGLIAVSLERLTYLVAPLDG